MTDEKQDDGGLDPEELRRRAIERLRSGRTEVSDMSGQEIKHLVHELEVHQVELEVQNEELRRTQTELAEAHDRYRDLYEWAPVGYLRLEADGTVREVNHTLTELCGRSRQDVIGRRVERLLAHEDRDRCYRLLRNVVGAGKPDSAELRLEQPDGRVVWVGVDVLPIPDGGERPCRGLGLTMRDITERKQAEEELKHLNETLEERVAERTAEVKKQAEQLRALAVQLSQTEQRERKRLAQLLHDHIQQLLVAARLQVERIKRCEGMDCVRNVAASLNQTLGETIEASRSLVVDLSPPVLVESGLVGALKWLASRMREKHHFEVQLRADDRAEPATEETRFLLFECARELLFNAAKHAGVREAELILMRGDDNQLELIISDRGEGFDPDLLANRRTDEATFGLFSIRERLVHIGGRMDVETAPGRGTRITLTAPLGEPAEGTQGQPEATTTHKGEETVRMRRRSEICRVLVVDDHEIMREGLVGLLQFESDIEVVGEAADCPEAVEKARKLKPDVIIMDVNLGGTSGIEATKNILAADPSVKVIGLSMHGDADVAGAMRAVGAVAYLPKGGPSDDLVQAIRESVGKR